MYLYNRKLRAGAYSLRVIALCNSWCCIGSAYVEEISSYHSFYWNILILCIHNVVLMLVFYGPWTLFWSFQPKHFFDRLKAFLYTLLLSRGFVLIRYCLHREINLYQSFYWSFLIFCMLNTDILCICMKSCNAKKVSDGCLSNLAILNDMCIDRAYAGK